MRLVTVSMHANTRPVDCIMRSGGDEMASKVKLSSLVSNSLGRRGTSFHCRGDDEGVPHSLRSLCWLLSDLVTRRKSLRNSLSRRPALKRGSVTENLRDGHG